MIFSSSLSSRRRRRRRGLRWRAKKRNGWKEDGKGKRPPHPTHNRLLFLLLLLSPPSLRSSSKCPFSPSLLWCTRPPSAACAARHKRRPFLFVHPSPSSILLRPQKQRKTFSPSFFFLRVGFGGVGNVDLRLTEEEEEPRGGGCHLMLLPERSGVTASDCYRTRAVKDLTVCGVKVTWKVPLGERLVWRILCGHHVTRHLLLLFLFLSPLPPVWEARATLETRKKGGTDGPFSRSPSIFTAAVVVLCAVRT